MSSSSLLRRLPRRMLSSAVPVAVATLLIGGAYAAQQAPAPAPAAPAAAAEAAPALALSVAADRADALYHVGDTARFVVKVGADAAGTVPAEIEWNLSKDGVAPRTSGKAPVRNGEAVVTGTLSEPGFLQCRISVKAADKTVTATAGAGFDPEKIPASLPVPDDFDAFWAAQKAKLAAVPINPRLTPVPGGPGGIETFDLQCDSVGEPVSGYFARPAGAAPRSLPAILKLHGAGVVSGNLGSAQGEARGGVLALDINAHGLPNGKDAQYYADLKEGRLNGYQYFGRESRETNYFVGMILRVQRALDFLKSQPEWDGRTLIAMGTSQGGLQAIAAGGMDPAVSLIVAGVPAGCDHSGGAVGRVSGWPKMVPTGADGKPDPGILQASRYVDVMNFATRVKAEAFVTVGFIDTTCPPTSVYAMFNQLPGKKAIFNDPPSTHRTTAQANKAMRDAYNAHLAARKSGAK